MKSKLFSLFFCFILIQSVASRPKSKLLSLSSGEIEPEAKTREKRKFETPILRQLEESGLGVKRSVAENEENGGKKVEVSTSRESEKMLEEPKTPEVPPEVDENKSRVKKQSPNNVCIKLGNCGKTACGPVVSARGQIANDMRTLFQAAKPIMTYSSAALDKMTDGASKPIMTFGTAALNAMTEGASKLDQMNPMQARTFDTLMGVAPLTLGSLGYGTPAVLSTSPVTASVTTDTGNYGHSFIKPPVSTVSTIPVAVFAQHGSPLMHPGMLSHLMPHLIPHMTPTIGTFLTPHRIQIEPERVPVTIQNDVKQPQPQPQPVPVPVPVPTPVFPPPSYFSSDSTLLCQPYRNQRLDSPFDYIYKPELPIDKSLNVSDSSKKSDDRMTDAEKERKIQEHLRKVNEIKEEISQLNRAAQRIVDQQERLTQMQQRSIWGSGSGSSSSSSQASASASGSPLHSVNQMMNPYMGAGYYQHPGMPWGYSRSNILSYPNSQDDIDFFVNVLRAGKRLGLISDSFQTSNPNSMSNGMKDLASNTGNTLKDTAAEAQSVVSDTKVEKPSIK